MALSAFVRRLETKRAFQYIPQIWMSFFQHHQRCRPAVSFHFPARQPPPLRCRASFCFRSTPGVQRVDFTGYFLSRRRFFALLKHGVHVLCFQPQSCCSWIDISAVSLPSAELDSLICASVFESAASAPLSFICQSATCLLLSPYSLRAFSSAARMTSTRSFCDSYFFDKSSLPGCK